MMRFLTLLLLAACETPKIFDSTDTSAPLDSSDASGDSTPDSVSESADTTDTAIPYEPSVTWTTVLASDNAFQDIQSGDPGAFYLTAPTAARDAGALWRIDESIDDLDDAPKWTGSDRREGFGNGISTFEIPGVGRGVALGEYAVDAGYAGRLLVALDDGSAFSGAMADSAMIDITGPVSGDGYSGGFFGFGAALWGDDLYVTQTNAEPAVYSGAAMESMTLSDMTAVSGVSADPYPDGGQGFVGGQVRSTGDGLLVCSAGGVCQHLGDAGADWYLYDGAVYVGEADLPTLDRDIAVDTFAAVIYGYYAVTMIGTDPLDRYVVVLNDAGEIITSDRSGNYVSIAAGETADGTNWTAWGAYAHLSETPDDDGLIYIVTVSPDGIATDTLIGLPLESPYSCVPRLSSDGGSTLAVMCYGGTYAMIGQIE